MYTLSPEKKLAVIAALVEGNSVRSIERMTGVHREHDLPPAGARLVTTALSCMDARMQQRPLRVRPVRRNLDVCGQERQARPR